MISPNIILLFFVCYGHATNKRFIRNTKPLYTLAGLFPVSRHDEALTDGVCDDFENDGWYMMLAMDFAIEKINAHSGYDFRLKSIKIDTCGITYDKDFWLRDFTNILESDKSNITGVVGASYTANSKIAAHASTMYEVPMISYQSSAMSISDTDYFPYLFRTIPIDDLQTIALKDLMTKLNLTYIALFYANNPYGVGLKEMLGKDQEGFDKICLLDGGYEIRLGSDSNHTLYYEKAVKNITGDNAIEAIAVFGYPQHVEKVQQAFKQRNQSIDDYIWIASDGWAQFDQDPGIKRVIGTTFSASILAGFSEFYNRTMKNLENNKTGQYHEDDQTAHTYERFKDNLEMKSVSSMESSTEDKINYITPVVEAVFAFAEALNNRSTDVSLDIRLKELSYNVSKVFKLKPSSCCGSHSGFERLSWGNESYGAYSYSAYRISSNKGTQYTVPGQMAKSKSGGTTEPWNIGTWHKEGDATAPNIDQEQLRLLLNSWNMTETSSQCQKCAAGWVQDTESNQCCYECVECNKLNQFTLITLPSDLRKCENCSASQRPLPNRMGCEEIIPTHITYSGPLESAIIFFSCVGIIGVSITYWYMFVYTYTPIARASGRSYMLLVAICTCLIFASPVVLFAVPSSFICLIQRVIVAGPTVGIIAACLVRTFSIDRIFRHPGVRQRLLSKRLVLLTIGFLIVIELFIESIIIVSMPSTAQNKTVIDHQSRILECKMPEEDIMLTFIFPGMLTVLCGIFALRIRKVPSNYNESRYILLTITIMTFESVIFFMSFKRLDYFHYIRYSVLCIIVGDYMTYFALFLPRLYIIVFKPERNTLQLQCSANGQFLMAKTMDRGCNTSFSVGEEDMVRLSSVETDDDMMTRINVSDSDQRISTL